ncbi:S41 family peptidase [Phenylobacterium sp. VNQ135]|uniref:S41 family peptidase n=1 Tax=Phenylobacterium sp. VNQ135 TaxID=3400922 RepID=UPI003C05E4C7
MVAAIAALSISAGAPAGAQPADPASAPPRYEPSAQEWQDAVAKVMGYIRNDYLGVPPDGTPPVQTGRAALRELAGRLDRQAEYIEPEDFDRLRERSRVGLDVRLTASPAHGLILTSVRPDGPGARAGLRIGDRLLSVNGTPVESRSPDDVLGSLAPSTPGPLNLRVERAGATISLSAEPDLGVRPRIRAAERRGPVGYVAVGSLGEKVSEELHAAILQLLAERDDLAGLVLDLRDCPGGLLDEVAPTAALFLGAGPVFQQRERDGQKPVRAKRKSRDVLGGRPLIVLVDSQTASGAELLAGALQERGRARLLGVRTQGMGLVQLIVPLVFGSGGAFKLTTSELQLPSGKGFHRRGLSPDIWVARSASDLDPDPRLHLRQDDLPEDPRLPIPATPAPVPTSVSMPPAGYEGDYQLDQAIALLSPPAA